MNVCTIGYNVLGMERARNRAGVISYPREEEQEKGREKGRLRDGKRLEQSLVCI